MRKLFAWIPYFCGVYFQRKAARIAYVIKRAEKRKPPAPTILLVLYGTVGYTYLRISQRYLALTCWIAGEANEV